MIIEALATGCLALGLVFLLEGLAWVLAPSFVERLLAFMATLAEVDRRRIGALALVAGLVLLWLAHALGA
ncbi:DUF2065 family protein [Pseudooceanicola marinus]|uniref:DUF2065 family protein n=1 Tax=Pseudooceanicola marinus TaxID=396013 RepID=UPI001CD70D15|nr:DUF2065 family protein [Pseudooceanicola marinus]MCA1335015.1 DUF2065 family protein [Pseudooceanicola marinus]